MMNYKQIEASREVRLWIGQVIVPAVVFYAASPEARNYINTKAKKVKDSIKAKLSK